MAMKVSFLQLTGEVMVVEVLPDTTSRELKEQIKECQHWNELTLRTTQVDIVVGLP